MPRLRLVALVLAGTCLAALHPGCEDPQAPPTGEPPVLLEQHSATCTDVWLRVRFQPGVQPRTFEIRRNSTLLLTATIAATETLILDEGLTPNTLFRYTLTTPHLAYDYTPAVSLTTMDTTSHEWVFDPPVYFGDGTFSELVDVAIINDTLAYAVGEIYLRDSTGQISNEAWNAVRWDGRAGTPRRIRFRGSCSAIDFPPLRAVHAVSPTSVFVTNGAGLLEFDGLEETLDCRTQPLLAGALNALFVMGTGQLWGVGGVGTMVVLGGSGWRRIESGTTVTINDVWGGSNPWIGEDVVLAAASNRFEAGEKKLLRIHDDGEVEALPWPMQDRPLHSVWFDGRSRIFTAGSGVFQYRGGARWSEQPLPGYFTNRIRGSEPNNIWVVGHFGLVAHFNGSTWRDYPELRINGIYHSVAVTQNTVIAVGYVGRDAIIVRGTKR